MDHDCCLHLVLLAALRHDSFIEAVLRKCMSLGCQTDLEVVRRQDNWIPPYLLQRNLFSTGFTSVHGESPSAEYAKLRKESLEFEFGHALGTYRKSVSVVPRFGPFLALYRAAIISFYVLKLSIWQFFVQDITKRAIKMELVAITCLSTIWGKAASQPSLPDPTEARVLCTRHKNHALGLVWRNVQIVDGFEVVVAQWAFSMRMLDRLGQALSTRPDILPTIYCEELAKLQDQIPPFPTRVAIKSIETQLGVPLSQIFADISPEPIAAASLGQVYKAHLHSGELVAVKVQRPGMSLSLTLDALLFQMIGGQLKRFSKARKDLLVAVNETTTSGMFKGHIFLPKSLYGLPLVPVAKELVQLVKNLQSYAPSQPSVCWP
uniref:ABC1 atypical kinase-like domain-containing protein n=1 Tax=Fagus sylvatica TaxID=28930 RepID=A0A2N9F3H7_FAGSY